MQISRIEAESTLEFASQAAWFGLNGANFSPSWVVYLDEGLC